MTDTTRAESPIDESGAVLEPTDKARRRVPRRAVHTVGDAALVVVATIVPLAILFRFWDGGFRVPFTYSSDALFHGSVTQNIIDNGWYLETDRLGAPLGQQMYDFALGGDNVQWLIIRVLATFSQDWALVMNAFFLLTFPLSALSAFFVLRWLGARRLTALPAGVLFAFAPYHFARGTDHLILASYAVVPIGVMLAMRAGRGEGPFSELRRRARGGGLKSLGWVVCIVLVGSCSAYYAVFSILLIATAAVVCSAARRSWTPLAAGAVAALLVAAVLGANLAPSILYTHEHGENTTVADRQPYEVDVYGLRVAQLLTPVPGHRVKPLAHLSDDLLSGPYNSETAMFLGSVGSVGLVAMIGWLFVRAVQRRRQPDDSAETTELDADEVDDRPLLAVFALVAILVGTTGGLDWFVSLAGLEEIHAWNRISIVIAFAVFCWLALTADRVLARLGDSALWKFGVVAGAVAVIALGIADQTSAEIVPDRRDVASELVADRTYFDEIERRMPTGAMVFQLPYVPYPESGPVVDIADYDPLRPYLNTHTLRWSYGAMKGRAADWPRHLVGLPADQLVEQVVAAGFSGLLVDRYGYEDRAAQLVRELQQITDDAGFRSEDGRWVFFDLAVPITRYEGATTKAQRSEHRRAVLEPVGAKVRNCYDGEQDPLTGRQFQWCDANGSITLTHSGPSRTYSVEMSFGAGRAGTTINLELPEGPRTLRADAAGVAKATFDIDLPDGETPIPYRSDAPRITGPDPARELYLRVDDPLITAQSGP